MLKKFNRYQVIASGFMLVSTAALSDELALREQAAAKVSQQFVEQLGQHLKKEMQSNGPVQAISVCREMAPEISGQLSLENGWRVTRVSNKVRNSLLGTTDQWERDSLATFESRMKNGESVSVMTRSEVVDEVGKSYYRFMKPLAIMPVCLKCHGSDEQIPQAVKEKLDDIYPYDKARNYRLGDLRGAISIKQPLDLPLSKSILSKDITSK